MTVLNQQSSLTKSKSLVLGAYRKWVQTVQWDAGAKKKQPTKKNNIFSQSCQALWLGLKIKLRQMNRRNECNFIKVLTSMRKQRLKEMAKPVCFYTKFDEERRVEHHGKNDWAKGMC